MHNLPIPFFTYLRQYEALRSEISEALDRVLNSGTLILGEELKKFEAAFAAYLGVDYAIGVNSGTDALKIAARALGLTAGDEVITVANTAIPTVSAIRELGLVPVFVDVKSDFLIDERQIEACITSKTKAILPVHLYGKTCEMRTISAIANKHNLAVIEDCAQAHGASFEGKMAGSFGTLACFSFYPTKNLGAYGDAGMIVTSNEVLASKCQKLRMYGTTGSYSAEIEGFNSRLDEIQAAILSVKLKHLPLWLVRRRSIAKQYLQNITNPRIHLPEIGDVTTHALHLFVVRTENRSELLDYLKAKGVGVGVHYPYPIHKQKAYSHLGHGPLSLTEKYSEEVVSLPIFPELTDQEVTRVIQALNDF